MSAIMRWLLLPFAMTALLLLGPVIAAVAGMANVSGDWRTASRAPAGIAPDPALVREAVVQVYGARAFSWRGAFAVHSWIALKPEGAERFTSYEVIGWRAMHGLSALSRRDGAPDTRWFGALPEIYVDLRGADAAALIPRIEAAVAAYPYKETYRTWPGPNSNTFTAYVARAVPELGLELPPTAVGKDFLGLDQVFATSPSGSGYQVSLFGVLGLLAAVEEGLEVNLLGLTFGIDPLDLQLKLPGLGRIGPG